MDVDHRHIILNNAKIVAREVDINKLKPYLLEFKIFTKSMLDDIENATELLSELPTRGPNAFKQFIEVLRKANYSSEANFLESCAISRKVSLQEEITVSEKDFYKMSSSPRGYCLIISNKEFLNAKFCTRYMFGQVIHALRNVFETIGYDVEPIKENLTCKGMHDTLVEFSGRNYNDVDSCVVIISSLGGTRDNLDVYYGIDGKYLSKYDVINLFNNENCPKLIMKPKIFLFISVKKNDERHRKESADLVIGEDTTDASECQKKYKLSIENEEVLLPTRSDIFVIRLNIPWDFKTQLFDHLFDHLISVLSSDYQTDDLETMVNTIIRKMANRLAEDPNTKFELCRDNFACTKKIKFYNEYNS